MANEEHTEWLPTSVASKPSISGQIRLTVFWMCSAVIFDVMGTIFDLYFTRLMLELRLQP